MYVDTVNQALWFVAVALIWGGTNPLLKQGGQGIERIQEKNALLQFVAEVKFLILNWKYLFPFALNQSGSLIYYYTLGSADISLAVPITNSLTFIFTGLSGKLVGEKFGNAETYIGILLVLVGVTLCVASKF